jgi:hypothetical protein
MQANDNRKRTAPAYSVPPPPQVKRANVSIPPVAPSPVYSAPTPVAGVYQPPGAQIEFKYAPAKYIFNIEPERDLMFLPFNGDGKGFRSVLVYKNNPLLRPMVALPEMEVTYEMIIPGSKRDLELKSKKKKQQSNHQVDPKVVQIRLGERGIRRNPQNPSVFEKKNAQGEWGPINETTRRVFEWFDRLGKMAERFSIEHKRDKAVMGMPVRCTDEAERDESKTKHETLHLRVQGDQDKMTGEINFTPRVRGPNQESVPFEHACRYSKGGKMVSVVCLASLYCAMKRTVMINASTLGFKKFGDGKDESERQLVLDPECDFGGDTYFYGLAGEAAELEGPEAIEAAAGLLDNENDDQYYGGDDDKENQHPQQEVDDQVLAMMACTNSTAVPEGTSSTFVNPPTN